MGAKNQKENMLISIIIPTYNVAPYVGECLDSIAAQTYKGDVECILVDDCSTDNTRDVVAQWLEGYQGKFLFRKLNLSKNGGLSNARNKGMEVCHGDWILFVDSDDAITPDCLNVMTQAQKSHPDADFIYCNTRNMGGKTQKHGVLPAYTHNREWLLRQTMFSRGCIAPHAWNKLIRSSILKQHDIKFIKGIIHEDVSFTCQLSQYVRGACFCKEYTYLYRTNREGSIISSSPQKQDFQFKSRLTLTHFLLEHITEEYRSLQLCALLERILNYIRITDIHVLMSHVPEIKDLEKQLLGELSGGIKALASLYFSFPLSLQKNIWANKILAKITRNI